MNIQNYLPHRYPFLLIDKIIDFKKHDYLIAQKNVSNNEPFFQGHFPEYPKINQTTCIRDSSRTLEI